LNPEEILKSEGLELPAASPAVANYVRAVRVGNLVFVSGHGPFRDGRAAIQGKLGAQLSVEEGQEAARLVTLNILATLKQELGDLVAVKRVVKLLVMVNATPEFQDHPKVADGSTDLLVKLYGDAGRPARSAVGMGSLPFDIPVEIEGIFEV
jgi:enamine deaminase RidA (YjgF/YER057c/UK114 family)